MGSFLCSLPPQNKVAEKIDVINRIQQCIRKCLDRSRVNADLTNTITSIESQVKRRQLSPDRGSTLIGQALETRRREFKKTLPECKEALHYLRDLIIALRPKG